MDKKRLIALFLIIATLCAGCGNNNVHVQNDETTPPTNTTTPTENKDNISETEPSTQIEQTDVKMWDKEYSEIKIDSVVMSQDWDKAIEFCGVDISSSSMTDASLLNNHHYYPNSSHGDLETLYYVPTVMFELKDEISVGKFSYVATNIIFTTLLQEGTNETTRNAIVEEIRIGADTNPYEGGLDEIANSVNYDDDKFGIGSNYKHVINMLGEPIESYEDESDDVVKLTTCVYLKEDAELILTFMWMSDGGVDSAILVGIDWIPINIRDTLRAQPLLNTFENYQNIYNSYKNAQ